MGSRGGDPRMAPVARFRLVPSDRRLCFSSRGEKGELDIGAQVVPRHAGKEG